MADETEVTETQDTSTEQGASEGKSILQHVQEEMKPDDKKTESLQEPEPKPEQEDKKGKVKLSANERVQQAVNEKNEAVTKLKESTEVIGKLQERLDSIEKRLETGEITKTEAKQEVKGEIEDIELDDDLIPYKDKLIKMAEKIADRIVSSKLQPILEKEKLKEAEAIKTESDKYTNELFDHYTAQAKQYPELFLPVEEGKEGELPRFKPEFDKQAQEYAKFAEVMVMVDGQPQIYNPLLATKEGLNTLFMHLSKNIDQAKKAKSDIEKIDRIKRNRIESPESRHVSSEEPKTILDLTRETIKEFSGG